MKTPSLSKRILSAWVINRDKGGSHMDIVDVASAVYGEYLFQSNSKSTRYAQSTLLDSVKTNIPHAIALATEHGIFVSTKRKPTNSDPTRKHRVEGWRIFVKGEDEDYLIDELEYKKRNGEARINSFNQLADVALNRGLIQPDKLKELSQ